MHGTRIRKPDEGNDTLNPSESRCKHYMHTLYKIIHAIHPFLSQKDLSYTNTFALLIQVSYPSLVVTFSMVEAVTSLKRP